MDDAQDINCIPGNTEYGSVGAIQKMAIGGAELLVFRDQRTALGKLLKRDDLLLKAPDESSGVLRAVGGDVTPYLLDIVLGSRRNLDFIFYGHS